MDAHCTRRQGGGMTIQVLSNHDARAHFLARHGLAGGRSGAGKGDDLGRVIGDLGFVQIDSVNTFARAHDLILWSRRTQYRPRALELHLSRDRQVFEHWTHDASTIPIDQFPYWRLRFKRAAAELESRWASGRRGDFMSKTQEVLQQISDHGCCTSADVGEGEQKGGGGWWDWHPSKTALEYLWHSGQLSVARREGFRKVYDLTERVIPDHIRSVQIDDEESIDWHCAQALRRLGFATSGEISSFWATVTKPEAKAWCAKALASGRIAEIDVLGVDGTPRRHFCWPGFADEAVPDVAKTTRLLSPFDPALRDRKRAERLFGFHYRIEIFVPAPKRKYGYYVFPMMEGDRPIGRIDMKRNGRVLDVTAFWPEPGVRMGSGRVARIKSELARAARFGGCDDIAYARDWLRG